MSVKTTDLNRDDIEHTEAIVLGPNHEAYFGENFPVATYIGPVPDIKVESPDAYGTIIRHLETEKVPKFIKKRD